jgi:hypothetical protein
VEKIKLTDKSGNYILIDSTTKNEEHKVQGDKIDNITVNKTETIGGNKTEIITGEKSSTVVLNKTENITLQWNITCGGNATINAPIISLNGRLMCTAGAGLSALIDALTFEVTGGAVKLGSQSTMRKLLMDTFMAIFNGHTHDGCGGSSNSDPPNQQIDASHFTTNLEAS